MQFLEILWNNLKCLDRCYHCSFIHFKPNSSYLALKRVKCEWLGNIQYNLSWSQIPGIKYLAQHLNVYCKFLIPQNQFAEYHSLPIKSHIFVFFKISRKSKLVSEDELLILPPLSHIFHNLQPRFTFLFEWTEHCSLRQCIQ